MRKNRLRSSFIKQLTLLGLMVMTLIYVPLVNVDATPPSAIDGITILIYDQACTQETSTFSNHVDLLVKKEEVGNRILSTPNASYVDQFGHIEEIDYLLSEDQVWISYLAYVKDATIFHEDVCNMTFMVEPDNYRSYTTFKLVYFDDQGQTLFISEPIENIVASEGRARYGEVQFYPYNDFHIENTYHVSGNLRWIVALIILVSVFKILPWIFLGIAGIVILFALSYVLMKQIKRAKHHHLR